MQNRHETKKLILDAHRILYGKDMEESSEYLNEEVKEPPPKKKKTT